MQDLVIRGVRPWGGESADIAVRDGRIAAIGADLPALPGEEIIDGRGCLVIPGLVDAHAHIDKTLWGTPWHPHQAGPSLMDKITNERQVLAGLGLSPEVQSARLLRRLIACGTTHVRTHVDVGPDVGLKHLHGVQAMRERYRDWMDIDMVAFPQTGVMIRPGTLDLLEQAVRDGAEVIGGLDPVGVDRDPKGQLDGIFAIAGRHGCEVDIHLHDRGDLGAVTMEMIAERTRSLGLAGKVAISHAFCLGGVEPARLESLIALLLENDIAIMTHAPSGTTPFPPIRLLHERGVRLFSGSDGIRDTWSPLNNGDMLERAFMLAYRSGFRDDAGIEIALRMATYGGAQVMGAQHYGLSVGSNADLVLVAAETAAEAVAYHPPRRLVLKRGRVVARDGQALLPANA
ncbi:Amidohydrolase family protein [Polaromonas sp. OV174]|uniref:amidohydrolase family protein n=1 Tax=Polaromonas sp. OV174 TaxID=1855300 RepID=UPI0008EEBB6A|nr:amidohydrolase family protein [Polaromonas sp. OV174]SFB85544.1 Amidohydrolase family protein [Polaromonas sp. OV174]